MKRLEISPAALADSDEIAGYIDEDNPDRAASFAAELEARARQAAERPRSFPARGDVLRGLQAAAHGRYPLFFNAGRQGPRRQGPAWRA